MGQDRSNSEALAKRVADLEAALGSGDADRCELCGVSFAAASPGCLTAEAHLG